MAVHYDPGVGVGQRTGYGRDTIVEPGEVLVAAFVVGAEPHVLDVWGDLGDVDGVVGLAA